MKTERIIRIEVASSKLPRWLLVTAVIAASAYGAYALRGVLAPVFFSYLVAYALDPAVDAFERRGLPRWVGIVVLLTLLVGVVTLFAVLAVPSIVEDVGNFLADLPTKLQQLRTTVEPMLRENGVTVPRTIEEVLAEIPAHLGDLKAALAPAASVVGFVAGSTVSVATTLANLVLFPVLVVYLLYDFDRMTVVMRDLVPHRVRPFVVDVAKEVDEVLGHFIRGQLLLMLAMGVLYAVAYTICGVRLAIVIGIIGGLLAFIPYVGSATAIGLALVMSLIDWGGWTQIASVIVAYIVIQVVESYVLQPKIVGDRVGLSAVWVLVALMAGGELFGFTGVLLAVPFAAVMKIFVLRGLEWYRKSDLFAVGAPEHDGVVENVLAAEGLPDSPELKEEKRAADPHLAEGPHAGSPEVAAPTTIEEEAAEAEPPASESVDGDGIDEPEDET